MLSQIDFKGQKMMLLSIVVLMVVILWAFFGFNQLKSGNSFQDNIVDWIIENAIKSSQPTAPALLKSLWKSKLGDLKFNTDEMIYSTSDNYESLTLNEKTKDANLKDLFDNSQDTKIIAFGNNLSNKTYVLKKDGTGTLDGNALNKEDLKTIGKDISTIAIGSFSEKKANEIINKHFPRGNKVKLDEDKYLVAIDMVSNGNNVKLAQTNTPSSPTTPSTTRVIIPSRLYIRGTTGGAVYKLKHAGEELNDSNRNQTIKTNTFNGHYSTKIVLSEDPSHNIVGRIIEEKLVCDEWYSEDSGYCVLGCEEPLYLADNGVTVKAKDCAIPWTTYQWEWEDWYYAVDAVDVLHKIFANDFDQRGDGDFWARNVVTSNIDNMSGLFVNRPNFNQDISNWDTSNVTTMYGMFSGAKSFDQDISNWDTSKVKNMSLMFQKAEKFDQSLNDWDISNVEDISWMFAHADSFDQPLDKWNTSNVKDMSYVFYSADWFNRPLNTWNTKKVTTMKNMFRWAHSFDQPLDKWNTSNVTDMEWMFFWAEWFNQNINDWDVSNVTNMEQLFCSAKSFNQPLDKWNVSNVTNMKSMFHTAESFNQPLNKWKTNKVKNMHSMFLLAGRFNQPLDKWDTSNVTDMGGMFYWADSFNQNLNNWNVNKVTDMKEMFHNAYDFNPSNANFYNFTTENKK